VATPAQESAGTVCLDGVGFRWAHAVSGYVREHLAGLFALGVDATPTVLVAGAVVRPEARPIDAAVTRATGAR